MLVFGSVCVFMRFMRVGMCGCLCGIFVLYFCVFESFVHVRLECVSLRM